MDIVKQAIKEDRVNKDITSIIVPDIKAKAYIVFKEKGVLCGLNIAGEVFKKVDKDLKIRILKKDGDFIKKGEKVIEIYGKARSILKAERVALNFLQHLSGIATATRNFVSEAGFIKIYDTRKTIPGIRVLQKYAVRTGGGINYRNNLEECVMIKDNHWVFWDGNKDVYFKLKKNRWKNKKIVIEIDSLKKLKKIVNLHPDIIMLDNMNISQIKRAISIIRSVSEKIEIEVSGNIDIKKLKHLKKLKIKRVSIGALTHSVKSIDISLKFYE